MFALDFDVAAMNVWLGILLQLAFGLIFDTTQIALEFVMRKRMGRGTQWVPHFLKGTGFEEGVKTDD